MNTSPSVDAALKHAQTTAGPVREVKVWDVPTRIFHWLIVALVAIAWATGEEEGAMFLIHTLAGYALLAALLFRIAWGFVGGAYARFASFLRSPSVTFAYTKQLLSLKPPHYVGHNPLGGWMIIALLAVLALIVVSGLFAQGEEGLAGPWAASAIGLSAKEWYEVHEVLFNVLLALIVMHIAGVIIDQLLTRDKLVKAMLTGNKQVAQRAQTLQAPTVGAGRALGVLAVALIATGFLVGWQLPDATATAAEAAVEHDDEREHEAR